MNVIAPSKEEMERDSIVKHVEFEEINVGVSIPALLCSIPVFPIVLCNSCWTLEPKQEAIVIHCGTVTDVVTQEGCHWNTCCCREIRKISTTQYVVDIDSQKITDSHGSPIMVSCILNYRFTDAKKALLNVTNPKYFIECQASAVVRTVVGKFSYEELKSSSDSFSEECVKLLTPLVETAGCTVQSLSLNELNYAPEIAEAMLKKQQAMALLDARAMLVEGAVEIATKAIQGLEGEGIQMPDTEKSKLATDLITVFVGTTDADS